LPIVSASGESSGTHVLEVATVDYDFTNLDRNLVDVSVTDRLHYFGPISHGRHTKLLGTMLKLSVYGGRKEYIDYSWLLPHYLTFSHPIPRKGSSRRF